MDFKKVFRGYDPQEVEKYIADTAQKEQQLRASQKERIDELLDENYILRQQVKQYQTDEQAISKSLIASQNLAQELKFDAEKYSDLVLSRAKIFYATWRAYSQTLIASLSAEEVREFNALQRKIESVINAYEGKDVAKEMTERAENNKQTDAGVITDTKSDSQKQAVATEALVQSAEASMAETVEVTPSETTMGVFANPITKIENAADQVIDLRELTHPDMSLEDLCAELGLTVKK